MCSLVTFGWFSLKLGGRLNPRRIYKYSKIYNFSEYLAKRQMYFNLKLLLGIGRGAHIEPIKCNKYVRWRKVGQLYRGKKTCTTAQTSNIIFQILTLDSAHKQHSKMHILQKPFTWFMHVSSRASSSATATYTYYPIHVCTTGYFYYSQMRLYS